MAQSNYFILLVLMFTVNCLKTARAENKKVIIKVPQNTKHIHHVKKVPIYILIPQKSPKIVPQLNSEDEENSNVPVSQSRETQCKEKHIHHIEVPLNNYSKYGRYPSSDSYYRYQSDVDNGYQKQLDFVPMASEYGEVENYQKDFDKLISPVLSVESEDYSFDSRRLKTPSPSTDAPSVSYAYSAQGIMPPPSPPIQHKRSGKKHNRYSSDNQRPVVGESYQYRIQ